MLTLGASRKSWTSGYEGERTRNGDVGYALERIAIMKTVMNGVTRRYATCRRWSRELDCARPLGKVGCLSASGCGCRADELDITARGEESPRIVASVAWKELAVAVLMVGGGVQEADRHRPVERRLLFSAVLQNSWTRGHAALRQGIVGAPRTGRRA